MSETKEVVIHYHDGAKQEISVPQRTRYLEITPNVGMIFAHIEKPKRPYGRFTYDGGIDTNSRCSHDRLPKVDGLKRSILLKIDG